MEVQIDASSCEEKLREIAFALDPVFRELNSRIIETSIYHDITIAWPASSMRR
jgi:hypothetical protein